MTADPMGRGAELLCTLAGPVAGGLTVLLWRWYPELAVAGLVQTVFNLLPVPPLDGFGILTQIFKLYRYPWYWTVSKNGFLILMLLILFDVTDLVLGPVTGFFYDLLLY